MKVGNLIIRKIFKIYATRCHILMQQIRRMHSASSKLDIQVVETL